MLMTIKMKMMMREVLTVPVCRKRCQVRLTSWPESLIPATAQHFHLVLLIMLYKVYVNLNNLNTGHRVACGMFFKTKDLCTCNKNN